MIARIAILLTNNDESSFSLRFPNDGEKVATQLTALRPTWDCKIWSVKDNEFPLLTNADAFVITGSPASVHDPWPWINRLAALVRDIYRARLPLVGLCFGHQIIATALGGKVERSEKGWRFGVAETDWTSVRDWMQPARTRLRLYASHAEQVTRLPEAAEVLGIAPNCPYASYSIEAHVITTQYHPEFTYDFMQALAHEYRGEVPPEVLQRGEVELNRPTDGAVFFAWVARFIESASVGPTPPSAIS